MLNCTYRNSTDLTLHCYSRWSILSQRKALCIYVRTWTNEGTESRGRPLCLIDWVEVHYTIAFCIRSFAANIRIQHRDIHYLFLKHHQKPRGQESIIQCANMTSVKYVKSGNTINSLFNSQRI